MSNRRLYQLKAVKDFDIVNYQVVLNDETLYQGSIRTEARKLYEQYVELKLPVRYICTCTPITTMFTAKDIEAGNLKSQVLNIVPDVIAECLRHTFGGVEIPEELYNEAINNYSRYFILNNKK